jgi:hypothetical protein
VGSDAVSLGSVFCCGECLGHLVMSHQGVVGLGEFGIVLRCRKLCEVSQVSSRALGACV